MTAESRWFEIRDADVAPDLSRIRLLAVPYDTWTQLGWGVAERMLSGVFDKSIREAKRGLPLLLFHDNKSMPIGKSDAWTLDDPAGLIGAWQVDVADEVAREAARKVRDGYLNGASVGFQPIPSRITTVWNDEDGWDERMSRADAELQITHHEGRLLETSLTPTPAYVGAGTRSALTEIERPKRDTIRRVGVNADTQLAISEFRAAAERIGARS